MSQNLQLVPFAFNSIQAILSTPEITILTSPTLSFRYVFLANMTQQVYQIKTSHDI